MASTLFQSPCVRRTLVCCLVISSLHVVAVSSAVAKAPRPFGGRVVANWDNVFAALPAPVGAGSANFVGTSQMLHMGRAGQVGTLSLGFPNAMGLAPGSGSVTITAANGDSVSFDFTGTLNAGTGQGIGNFVITGGTGRFTGATGGGQFFAQIDLTAPTHQRMTVVLEGTILY